MNNKTLIAGIVVVVALIAGIVLLTKGSTPATPTAEYTTPQAQETPSATSEGQMQEASSNAMMEKGTVKTFTVTGSPFKFNPSQIRVKKGDTVKITFKNAQGFHDFVIDEFKVKTKQLPQGGEETVEFVASMAGTYQYYCSVDSHKAQGMVGTLTVE